jgi:DNA-binding IclR family transcriptional regulator
MRDGGASVAEIVERTGWKKNSVHAALSTLRKRGSPIEINQCGGEWRYRIVR